jgi:hypothetical protein
LISNLNNWILSSRTFHKTTRPTFDVCLLYSRLLIRKLNPFVESYKTFRIKFTVLLNLEMVTDVDRFSYTWIYGLWLSQLEGGWRGRGSQTLSHMYTLTVLKFSQYLSTYLWRWNRKSVQKRRHIKFRRRGSTQKKTYIGLRFMICGSVHLQIFT